MDLVRKAILLRTTTKRVVQPMPPKEQKISSPPHKMKKKIIVVVGPTAVGKTAFAIALAQSLNTVVLGADSRQCYKELSIGVARPSPEELAAVPHYFVGSHSLQENINAGFFERYALDCLEKLFVDHDQVVVCGGTGLYVQALCEGIDPMPSIPEGLRDNIVQQYHTKGLVWLQKELAVKDPGFWAVAEKQNPQRLMRALEVFLATGNSILYYRQKKTVDRPFAIEKMGLDMSMEKLTDRINWRVDKMMADGLLAEVKSLLPYREAVALQTVGYKEIFAHLDGQVDLPTAVAAIKTHTRQYAKRQLTWFRKDPAIQWQQMG
ncbi:MAG: tRNA (adenosine(37)-N6)-dimethylallyltransferase MiaA [Sphingobacteriia bacterium]|nr:MAG: tRNA (adenosine(37)-N6)-dimethylallyltransferase MiaA [Sphingobacteriia bacterium]